MNEKGRAVFTECPFKKGSFVCEYHGELIDIDEAKRREKSYTTEKGSFVFYFQYGRKMWLVS